MKDLKKLEELKKELSRLIASKKKFLKLSEKRSSMSHSDNTKKSIESAEADLNWHAMEHDKIFRLVHALSVDCGLSLAKDDYSDVEYNPSQFHKYTFKQPLPMCRK